MMPLDPVPVVGGNVRPVPDTTPVLAEVGQPGTDEAWQAHFVTCPQADEHRVSTPDYPRRGKRTRRPQ